MSPKYVWYEVSFSKKFGFQSLKCARRSHWKAFTLVLIKMIYLYADSIIKWLKFRWFFNKSLFEIIKNYAEQICKNFTKLEYIASVLKWYTSIILHILSKSQEKHCGICLWQLRDHYTCFQLLSLWWAAFVTRNSNLLFLSQTQHKIILAQPSFKIDYTHPSILDGDCWTNCIQMLTIAHNNHT